MKRRGPGSFSLSEVETPTFLNDSMVICNYLLVFLLFSPRLSFQASINSYGLPPPTPTLGDNLQYLDLDLEGNGSPSKAAMNSMSSNMSISSQMPSLDVSLNSSMKDVPGCYTTIDFVKTDAFNRVREDSEMTRASKSRMKN